MTNEFENRTIVVTGAASGMGFLCCYEYVARGGCAVLGDINPEALDAAVKKINVLREGSAVGAVCDVRKYEDICRLRDLAVQTFGRIDLAVPCAGGAEMRMLGVDGTLEFPDVPIEVFDWSLDVNLRGQLYLSHAVLSQMREQKSGLVVLIGSITGEEGSSNNIGYAASKSGAMYGMTRSVALAGAKYGVRCVCISPGPVLTRAAMANMRTLLERAAEPQEIVDMILYVASDKGQFLNATNILIDGGRSALPKKGYRDIKK